MVGHSKPNSNPVFCSYPEKACGQTSQVLIPSCRKIKWTLKMFFSKRNPLFQAPMLMEEILHRLGCIKPYELLGYQLHQLVGRISEPSTVCWFSRVAHGTLNNLGRSRQVVYPLLSLVVVELNPKLRANLNSKQMPTEASNKQISQPWKRLGLVARIRESYLEMTKKNTTCFRVASRWFQYD